MRIDDGVRGELYDYDEGWKVLGMGHPVPEGMDVKLAFLQAHRIWLKAIKPFITGHPMIVSAAFTSAIYGPIEVSGKTMDFGDFAEYGLAGGVDYMIDAWLSGVPLEYVLAE